MKKKKERKISRTIDNLLNRAESGVRYIDKLLFLGTFAIVSHFCIEEFGDEIFSETQEEQRVQDEFGIPIFLDHHLSDAERTRRVLAFESSVLEVREYWPNFDSQFEEINYVYIWSEVSWAEPILGGLFFYCSANERGYCDSDVTLIHEVGGHQWHLNLPASQREQFEEEWTAISGSQNYSCSLIEIFNDVFKRDGPRCSVDNCNERKRDLAAVSCYGTRHLWEDIAVYIEFVYRVNKYHAFEECLDQQLICSRNSYSCVPHHFSSIIPEIIPEVIQRIELLHEYRAFPKRERDLILEGLNAYYTNWQRGNGN